jgi:tyrosine-protein phosphatase SIW14
MLAKKIIINGVPNLWRVSDTLYRSAQPNKEGFRGLWNLDIREIINLRMLHNDLDVLNGPYPQVYLFRIPMACWHPEIEDIVRFLKIIKRNDPPLTLVHCKHGSDRTGAMVALYRIIIEGWTKEDALTEMQLSQFGYHWIWENLIDWIEGIDIEHIKSQLT